MLEIIYIIILIITFTAWFALTLFKREMKNKAKYKDYINDAIDAIENNSSSNLHYAHTSCSGIAFFRNADGEIECQSQSKLYSTAIKY